MRRFSILIILLLAVAGSGISVAQMSGTSPRANIQEITSKLLCPCGCDGMLLSSCFCETSQALHAEIQQQIDQGKTADEITAGLVARYGTQMWAAPPAEGFNLVGWIMPSVIMLILLTLFVWLIKAKVASHRLASMPAARQPTQPKQEYLERVEEELRKYRQNR